MKKIVIGGVVFTASVVALRRFGPTLGRRAMSKCEEMFDHMPEDFPPKKMLRGIEEIRQQNTVILDTLEGVRERPRTPSLVDAK